MSELRKDPVLGRWVIIAAERGKRPSDYPRTPPRTRTEKDVCPFCPGNEALTPPEICVFPPEENPTQSSGWSIRVVPNKYPAVVNEGEPVPKVEGLYERIIGTGSHEVIIETPDHNRTLSTQTEKQVEAIFRSYRDRILDLKKDRRFKFALVFKNHGRDAGATLEHTHSQLITLPIIPPDVVAEIEKAEEYYRKNRRCIYCDLIQQELTARIRVISENEAFLCIAPYAARFPFETCILPKGHYPRFEDMRGEDFSSLARILRETLYCQDKILDRPDYNYLIRSAPFDAKGLDPCCHWYMDIIPRLTHVAGFERGTGVYINPTAPEEAARFFREAVVQD